MGNLKRTLWELIRNSGFPKGRKSHGNGTLVVGKYYFSTLPKGGSRRLQTESIPKGLESLNVLYANNKKDPKLVNQRILRIIADQDALIEAYCKIRSKPGNMTPGSDKLTLDGISKRYFQRLAREIGSNAYQPKPTRRVYIPKPNGDKQPLGIPSPRDKIVQETCRKALEAIYEPTFSRNSHGFRPNRGCHTALKQIKMEFGEVAWFIKGDISKCFDTIPHRKLANILRERIDDKGFIDLYWKMVRAGYVEKGSNEIIPSQIGTSQGSVISPILSNILLDKFDQWMENKIIEFNKGTKRRSNPSYTKLISGTLKSLRKSKEVKLQGIPAHDPLDPNFKRLRYVRYANDFLIGIIGPKKDAILLKDQIKMFFETELEMTLNIEKTKIVHATSESPEFLGVKIRLYSPSKRPTRVVNYKGQRILKRVAINPRLQILIPLQRVFDRLTVYGFIHPSRKTPTALNWLIPYEDIQIVQYYNSVYRGIAGYYSCADNRPILARIHAILYYSCVLTLAKKFKLHTKHKVIKRFGRDLNIRNKSNEILVSFEKYS